MIINACTRMIRREEEEEDRKAKGEEDRWTRGQENILDRRKRGQEDKNLFLGQLWTKDAAAFFSPLRLRRNNFSCAIMRLTIEREKEDSDNAFSRFVFDRVIDIVAFGTKKCYTSINRVALTK